MPELPDLVHVVKQLSAALPGRKIVAARAGDPTVLRLMQAVSFPAVLVGRTFQRIERRGHFVCLFLDGDLALAVNCMLVGRFFLLPAGDGRAPKSTALAIDTDDGQELRYVDDRRMGKIYVASEAQFPDIPQLGTLGVDVLSPGFTRDHFRKLARRRRDQVRQFLMDKTAIASIGNAYADEILFAARLHPKTFVSKISPEEIDRLYAAIRDVTAAAIAEIERRGAPIDEKVRDFLKVRGRDGEPCPTCGTTLRAVRVGDGDACFCPQCQPATRPQFVDWQKLPGGKP